MKNILQQLKIVPTLESWGMFIQKLMQDFVKQLFFTGGKRGFDPKYIVSITTTAGEGDKTISTHQAALVVEVAPCMFRYTLVQQ